MKDLLRVVTAGSVDDGKSTLLGRILADTGSVPVDVLEQARADSARRGHDLDPSLLLDGLEDERAQGITIDVAYRYFETARRAFVLADAPGHARYTRNMATGAAGCDVALLLVDAARGVGPQTRRHAFVAALMGIRHVVVAVNKMDMVDWSQARFDEVCESFADLVVRLDVSDVSYVPVSALDGTNVVEANQVDWYHGPSLLERLETMHVASDRNLVDFRLPVQIVLPTEAERALAGTISAGVVRRGDEVMVLPSGERARINGLQVAARPAEEAFAGQAVSCTLDRELDVARGDVLIHPRNRPRVGRTLDTMLVWMDEAPLEPARSYWLKLGARWVTARVQAVDYRLDTETGHRAEAPRVGMNDIARVRLHLDAPLVHDEYRRVRSLGAFIVVDRDTHATAAAGVVIDRGAVEGETARKVVWMADNSDGRMWAARYAARRGDLTRLDAEALTAVVGSLEAPEAKDRVLATARLVLAAGGTPVVVALEPPEAEDVRAILTEAEAETLLDGA